MALFNFSFARSRIAGNSFDDVEMGERSQVGQSESAGRVEVPAPQAMLAPHVYPPQPLPDTKPRSLQHSPQTSNRSLALLRRQNRQTPSPSRSFLRHPSPQTPTPTQRSRTLSDHPSPQTPTQKLSAALTSTGSSDNQLALALIKPTNSVRKRIPDTEDPFAATNGRREQLGARTAQTETPVSKCRVMEIEDPNKEKVILAQATSIQMLKDQLAESHKMIQTFRDELIKKDAESSKKHREYEARIQEVEARLQQRTEDPQQQTESDVDEDMRLITPEVAEVLSVVAQKQKVENPHVETQIGAGEGSNRRRVAFQHDHTPDVYMDSDGDRRNAGNFQRESASPLPVPLTRVPKPMSYKKPRSGRVKLKVNPPVPPRLFVEESEGEEFPVSDSDQLPTSPPFRRRPAASSSSSHGVEEKLDKLLAILQGSSVRATPPMRKTMYSTMFHTPIAREPKSRGRNEMLAFVRNHLHSLLGIEHTADIAKYSDEIFAKDTPLQRRMAAYEEHGFKPPDLEPMRVNWKVFNGRWNQALCEGFLEYCVDKGLGEGHPNEDELQLVTNIFWERLGRIRTWITSNAPKKRETTEDAELRNAERHRGTLEVARRNTRRQQSYNSRVDTCLGYLPGEGQPDEESTAAWEDHLAIIETLGVEGQSSDETDEEDANIYNVRILPWRSKELVTKVSMTDKARNTTNAYGNPRSGNRPRTRKRRRQAQRSQRKAPRGKPLNYYDQDWYNTLTHGQKQALGALPVKPFLDTSFDDRY